MIGALEQGHGVDVGRLVRQPFQRNRAPAGPVVEVLQPRLGDQVIHERAGAGGDARRAQVERAAASGLRLRRRESGVHAGDQRLAARGNPQRAGGVPNPVADRVDVGGEVDLQNRHAGPLEERPGARSAAVGAHNQIRIERQHVLRARPDRRQPRGRGPEVREIFAGVRREREDALASGESEHELIRAVVQADDPAGGTLRPEPRRRRPAARGEAGRQQQRHPARARSESGGAAKRHHPYPSLPPPAVPAPPADCPEGRPGRLRGTRRFAVAETSRGIVSSKVEGLAP